MRQHGRRGIRALAVTAALGVASVGVFASGASAQSDSAPGVSDKSVKIGFISSESGAAASNFVGADKACQARIDAENKKGGVNGRKIDLIAIDDKSGAGNNTAAKDLVQSQNVFAVVNDSPFAFLTWRYLVDQKVPDDRGRLRRLLLLRPGQRVHDLEPRRRHPDPGDHQRHRSAGDEEARGHEGRRHRLRRVAVVERDGQGGRDLRGGRRGPRGRVPQQRPRVRQHRRRTDRARHQELGRRRCVPAARLQHQLLDHPVAAAERREDEGERAGDGLQPGPARPADRRRRSRRTT